MKSDVKLSAAFGYREMGDMRWEAGDMVGCWELWPKVVFWFAPVFVLVNA